MHAKKRMLVTGADGLLGREIVELFREEYDLRAADVGDFDVTSPADCGRAIGGFLPDIVIHCAAYTAVDKAESEEERAFAVNRGGTGNVARECRKAGALIVTFGTDYVFDGASDSPYEEGAAVSPLSAYGRSKLAAEEAARAETAEHLIVRSQWLYGPHGRNFVFAILDKARRGEPLRVVSDQKGCPTYARDLAAAVKRLLDAGARGTFHFSNEGEATWHEFAAFVLARAFTGAVSLEPARASELAYPARRPAYSVLSKEKYRKFTGDIPRRWEDAVQEFLKIISKGRVDR
ncbi:MAG TPA: dTDP-4-dehydrorhamnose reductase [Candidatus Deferrimicrobiaceae bacterium]